MYTPLNNTRALMFAAIASAMFSAPVFAQQAATPDTVVRHYEIAAGSVEEALSNFAKSAGVIVVFTPELVTGRQSPGLNREADINTALTLLLQGSGLQAVESETGSYVLKPVPSAGVGVLKAVKVTAEADRNESSYAAEVASIVRVTDSLKEVPQSVTVITSKLIEDQNLITMSDAMAKTPGIVATVDGLGNSEFRSRGFIIDNYQVDNLGTSYTSTYRPDFDLAIYDRVEVLRGADGLFSAAGEPGGTVNLARKRPTDELRSSVSLAYGSWDNSRIEADVGGAIALDGKLRGRLVGVWQDREFFYSPADEEKKVIYGILEYDLTSSTKISGGISQQHSDGLTWMSGLPTYPDGSQLGLPRDVALTVDWANRDTTIRETFFTAEHTFNQNWSAKLSAMKQRYDFDYMQLSVGGPVNPATGALGNPAAYSEDNGNHSDGVDLSVNGRFSAWNLEHKLVAGIDTRSSHGKQMRNNFNVSFPSGQLNIDDFPGLDLPEPTLGGYNHGWPAWGAEQEGVYARLDLQTTEKMHVILGGRYANYEDSSIYQRFDVDGNLTTSETTDWRENGIFTPNAAITYDVTSEWTAYFSFTEIYKPQNSFAGPPENQSKLDPITGRNHELGIKGSVLNEVLNVSAALYRIERNGEAMQDTRYGEDTNFFLPLGKIMSEGLDLEVSGEVVQGWEVFAGYTYNRNKNEVSNVIYSALTPKHIFKLWTDYNFQALPQLTLGGGVTAKSEHANTGTYWFRTDAGWTQPKFEIKQGGYAIWDAHVKYQLGDKWDLALNVNNAFDKNYYSTLGVPNGRNWYGTPRNATLTLRGEF